MPIGLFSSNVILFAKYRVCTFMRVEERICYCASVGVSDCVCRVCVCACVRAKERERVCVRCE